MKGKLRSLFLLVAGVTLIGGCGGSSSSGNNSTKSTYTLTYNANGASSGTVPVDPNNYAAGASVTVLGNTGNLTKSGETFSSWNTQANGTGTTYLPGNTMVMGSANVTLFALYSSVSGSTVTYNGNGATSGTVPVDSNSYAQGQSVTVLGNTGNLAYTGYTFVGWQTVADGSGTTYAPGSTFTMSATGSVTLYALWAQGYLYSVLQMGEATQPIAALAITPTGQLSLIGYTDEPAQAEDSSTLVADPQGRYLYVVNFCGPEGCSPPDGAIAQYAIGSNGSLTPMSTPVFDVGTANGGIGGFGLSGIAAHPSLPDVYVVANNTGVCQFQYSSTGALSAKGCTPPTFEGGGWPYVAVVVDPTGAFAWASAAGGSYTPTIQAYTISSPSGTLAVNGPPVGGAFTYGHEATFQIGAMLLASTTTGEYLYLSSEYNGAIFQYQVSPAGTIAPVGTDGIAQTCPSCPNPFDSWNNASGVENYGMAVDTSGQYVYVAAEVWASNASGLPTGSPTQVVIQMSIQGDGTLANPVQSVLIPASNNPDSNGVAEVKVFKSPVTSNEYLYASTGNSNITGGAGTQSTGAIFEFAINPQTGVLTPLANPSISVGSQGMVIVTP